jgi:NAD+ diphosphatase
MYSKVKYCPQCSAELAVKMIEGIERKVCEADQCNYVFWNNPIPVVVIIPETTEGIILAHNRNWPPGIFSVISGFIEMQEDPERACERELNEELGLKATEINFIGNFMFRKMNQLLVAYHVRADGVIQLNHELDQIKIVQREQLWGWKRNNRFEVGEWLNNLKVLEDN